MIGRTELEHWSKTWLRAEIWLCGDEFCDCHQPQIIRISPNIKAGFPVVLPEIIWAGTFHSCPGLYELRLQKLELRKAMRKFKIPRIDDKSSFDFPCGEREIHD